MTSDVNWDALYLVVLALYAFLHVARVFRHSPQARIPPPVFGVTRDAATMTASTNNGPRGEPTTTVPRSSVVESSSPRPEPPPAPPPAQPLVAVPRNEGVTERAVEEPRASRAVGDLVVARPTPESSGTRVTSRRPSVERGTPPEPTVVVPPVAAEAVPSACCAAPAVESGTRLQEVVDWAGYSGVGVCVSPGRTPVPELVLSSPHKGGGAGGGEEEGQSPHVSPSPPPAAAVAPPPPPGDAATEDTSTTTMTDTSTITTTSSTTRSSRKACAVCGSPAGRVCSRCRKTRYCSSQCQTSDWHSHKRACRASTPPRDQEPQQEAVPSESDTLTVVVPRALAQAEASGVSVLTADIVHLPTGGVPFPLKVTSVAPLPVMVSDRGGALQLLVRRGHTLYSVLYQCAVRRTLVPEGSSVVAFFFATWDHRSSSLLLSLVSEVPTADQW